MDIKGFLSKYRNKIIMISYILLFLYSSLMIWEVFIGPYRSHSSIRRYNLYPFKTIMDFIINNSKHSPKIVFINIAANIITFMPLGFLLTLLFKRFKKFLNLLLFSIVIIAIIESGQYILNVGVFDIDDIILNTIGCALGFWVCKIGTRFLKD